MQRASILITLGLAATACTAEGGEGMYLSKNVAPSDGCEFTASASEQFVVHGTSSVFGSGYMVYPQIISKITATDDQVQQRTIQLRGARVDIETTDSDLDGIPSEAKKFESRFAAPLLPNGGLTDAAFLGIPPAFLKAVRDRKGIKPGMDIQDYETEVIIHAKVFGDLAGDEVTSQEWEFPVTITANGVTNVIGMCPLASGTTFAAPTNACSAYQDGVADCCVTADDLQCPPSMGLPNFVLTAVPAGAGTITVMVGGATVINCSGHVGDDCSEPLVQGTMVTPVATPAAGGSLKTWSGACTGSALCTFTMDAAKTIGATFDVPVNVTVTGGGTVTSGSGGIMCTSMATSDCVEADAVGANVTLTATGGTVTWGGACAGTIGATCSLVPDKDAFNVTAAF